MLARRKYALIITGALLLTACSRGTFQDISFGQFGMRRYTHDKVYTLDNTAVQHNYISLYQAKQVGTGTTNSLIVSQLPVESWATLTDIIALNQDQLKLKLLKYTPIDDQDQTTDCQGTQLPWYLTSFSYDVGDGTTFWVMQYFFIQDQQLYLISFHASDEGDLSSMDQSISTLSCK